VVQKPAGGSRGQTVSILLRPPEMLWKYCQTRNQPIIREVENSDFILCWWSQMNSHSKFWAPINEFTGFLKDSAGHQVIRNVLETWGCLDRSSRGDLLWKVCLQRRQRKVEMGSYLYMGPFCFGPGLILWLN
jgi:hypothetical protein